MKITDVEKSTALKSVNPKKKRFSFSSNLLEHFSDYSRNSTIHGMKYLGEKNRSIPEKLCWLVVLGISFCLCIYLINKVYQKWQNAPVVVTFANNLLPIWEVPFPAVTICPMAKTRKTSYNYAEAFSRFREQRENMTEEEMKRFEQTSLLCGDYWNQEGSKVVGNDTIDFLFKISFKSDEWWCRWDYLNGRGQSCDDLLTPVFTDNGVCFTFNMLDREELFTSNIYYHGNLFHHRMKSTNWTLEKGYPKDLGMDSFPRRTSAGLTLTFSVLLTIYEPDLDSTCGGFVRGFQVYLHNPAEMPRMTRQFFMVSFNKLAVISIKPEMMTTSDELKSYDSQTRKCYFSHERHLKYFQVYTQRNCEFECFTNYTLEKCGCVAFYMPRDAVTEICGPGSGWCIDNAEKLMNAKEMNKGSVNYETETEEKCNCLPACTSLTYNTESSQVDYKWLERFKARNEDVSNVTEYAITDMYFFFKDQYFTTSERKELYGLTDFIANCGGLLGLFTGFSFLSIIEIFYFLSLRVMCSIKKHEFHFSPGSPKIRRDSEILTLNKKLQNIRGPVYHQVFRMNNKPLTEHHLTFVD